MHLAAVVKFNTGGSAGRLIALDSMEPRLEADEPKSHDR